MDAITDSLSLVPAVPMVRRGSDELRPIGEVRDPLPPIEGGGVQGGGGTQIAAVAIEHRDQIPPSSNSPGSVSQPPETTSAYPIAVGRPVVDPVLESERVEDEKLLFRWNGEPTRAMVRRLREMAWCPDFDEDQARLGVVRLWGRLLPEFGKTLEAVETDLGAFWRDRAGEEADAGDPAMVGARLKLAAAYDRRIVKGDDVVTGSVVNVQVNW
jgi:hypothetical protein